MINSNWSTIKKRTARKVIVMDNYRELFGLSALPVEKQYWTLPSESLSDSCEYRHVLREKFCTKKQFFGVERDPERFARMRYNTPEMQLMDGDFCQQMINWKRNNRFDPGVVHFDSQNWPSTVADYFGGILNVLSRINNVMVVGNFVIKRGNIPIDPKYPANGNPEKTMHSGDDVTEILCRSPVFLGAIEEGSWNFTETLYCYDGNNSNDAVTTMGSLIFYRK